MPQAAATANITPLVNGVLVDTDIHALINNGGLSAAVPLLAKQIQPASFDLRLGTKAYRVQAGFLPGSRTVMECIPELCMTELDLTQPQLFEKGSVYIVPLQESLTLPPHVCGIASAKSSTGRLDILTRLITNHSVTYDTIAPGYTGPLYLEIAPLTFPIVMRAGDLLNQVILYQGNIHVSDDELQTLHDKIPLLRHQNANPIAPGQMKQGLWISIDLQGTHSQGNADNPIVGYKARHHTQPVDLARVGGYKWSNFWEPIYRANSKPLILYPEEFYIFASAEGVCVPPDYAAELVAYDTRVGEIRVHYAGFFDPGFGYTGNAATNGTTAVLEVRAHDVPCVLEHGQPIGRFLYQKLLQQPTHLYGSGIGSNYANQGLKLGKQFNMDT